MERKTLVDTVADQLLDQIIEGSIEIGSALPAEADIAAKASVSRLTVREALKALRAKNVVNVQRGRGTFINPPEVWTSLEAMMRATARGVGEGNASLQLLEVRRMIETGAASLAAMRRTPADVDLLEKHLAGMEAASAAADVDAFVREDIAFHDVVLKASGNVLVPALYEPLNRLLASGRRETSAFPVIQHHAIGMHRNVLEAITTGNAEEARLAMDRHMDQTQEDLIRYVLA